MANVYKEIILFNALNVKIHYISKMVHVLVIQNVLMVKLTKHLIT